MILTPARPAFTYKAVLYARGLVFDGRISDAVPNAWVDSVAHLVPKVARNGVIDGKAVHLRQHALAESDTSRALADP